MVDPLGLVDKDDLWYLIARTEKGQRTFRVERVVSVELTEESFERPADFDLSAGMERDRRPDGGAAFRADRDRPDDERFVWVMQDRLGRNCEGYGVEDDWVRLKITAPTPLMIAQHLAGLGGSIDVVDPPSVQAELARLGHELAPDGPLG